MTDVPTESAMMTLEELRQIRGLKRNAEILEEEIAALYFPYTSPNAPKDGGQNPNRGSDPTARAFRRIEQRKERLERVMTEYRARAEAVEDWILTLQDLDLAAIIRAHFILGKTWRDTAKIVYGYASRQTPRMKVERYFTGKKEARKMEQARIVKTLESKYDAKFRKENRDGKTTYIQKTPVYIAIKETEKDGIFHVIITPKENALPEIMNEEMTGEEAIRRCGEIMLRPENRMPEQLRLI